ncbi:DUF4249 domain-containing protein [Hymenobacter chitinivorans]|uniref:Uncharacterized protein DUF4249 n=1 Tax=Hymenobacter chitinivorans DSM 11115 TaxID=1121954 RepID=A0A2M9BLJ0_9BACT|nr:DUF4249 domain-containing protein [Hymenobacter chitinivorans]PJJ58802.1 uncharacterized protein DUF4249 [Hymenobacter chitinivorans DSM 11115]
MLTLFTLNRRSAALAVLSAGLVLSGCETVIDLPEPAHTPRIALKYILSNYTTQRQHDELANTRTLFVSTSQRIFSTKDVRGRKDATVVILDENGTEVERFQPVPPTSPYDTFNIGTYQPTRNLKGEPGRTYTLQASLPGFETVESKLTLPAVPVIESATFIKNVSKSDQSNVYGQLSITVADDPGATNYYVAFARVVDSQNNQYQGWSQVDIATDESDVDVDLGQFQLSTIYSFQGYGYDLFPFADAAVNGKRFSLTTNVRYYDGYCPQASNCQRPDYMEVYVTSMTQDTYNFFLARRRYNDSEGNPFAEPAPLPSNIRPGYGLFGGMTDAVYRIKLR